jgi:outer membrane murein-binding lipoprotein Lpp
MSTFSAAASKQITHAKAWLEHPLYVGAVAVAGTLLLCIPLYKEVLLPAQTASLQYQTEELERSLTQAETTAKAAKDRENRLAGEMETQAQTISRLSTGLNELKTGSLFLDGSVYPIGYEKVRIDDSIDILTKHYPGATIAQKTEDYWSVKVEHPFFRHITYYFRESSRKISGCLRWKISAWPWRRLCRKSD